MIKNEHFIRSIGFKNFRSLDNDGIMLENLKQINFLIGKNNSGKSNILKFLKTLNTVHPSYDGFPSDIENQHGVTNYPAGVTTKFKFNDLKFPSTYWSPSRGRNVSAYELFEDEVSIELTLKSNSPYATLRRKANAYDSDSNEFFAAIVNSLQLSYNYPEQKMVVNRYCGDFFYNWLKGFVPRIIYIPDIRIIQEKNNIEKSNSRINGSNLISELNKMKNYEVGEDDKFKKLRNIERKIAELLDVDNVEIEIPSSGKTLILKIGKTRYALENFGSGVHELVLLCCFVMLNEKCLICMEEPEIHLHPELQRRLLKFISSTQHQYFITTHSNIFLDYFESNASFYHIKYDGSKSSLNQSLTNVHLREIINELGFKASDILQTNGIIWVEGPSDRNYIKRWIELTEPSFTEGVHYTVMFYGGKLLSNVSFQQEEQTELIEMMKINPNVLVIMDRDKKSLNETKRRIITELGEDRTWVTRGIEVENYLPIEVVNTWLTSKNLKPFKGVKSIIKGKFEIAIKSVNENFKYNLNKNVYSKEIASYFFNEMVFPHDLKEQMERLINSIRLWNKK